MFSPVDSALKLGSKVGEIAGYAGEPIGLGWVRNVPESVVSRVIQIPTNMDHSDAFLPTNRNETFALAAHHFGLAVQSNMIRV